MNKLLLILVIVVVLIVGLVIGVIGYFELYQHTTKLNNYTGNGVSFEYPTDYNITEVKNNSNVENFSSFNATKLEISQAFLIAQNKKNPDLTFQVSKSPVNGTVYHGISLDEYFESLINDLKSRGWYIDADNTTTTQKVNNTSEKVQTYIINYDEKLRSKADSVNGEIMMLDINGVRYIIAFQGKGNQNYDDRAFSTVLNSFKVLPGN
jgi:hypothetical protein